MPTKKVAMLGAACLCGSLPVSAQYSIPWHKIAGGGSSVTTAGVYTLKSTLGQVDTGRLSGTNGLRIDTGFWAIPVQQPGMPALQITAFGPNAMLWWVTPEVNLILQHSSPLATTPAGWIDFGPATSVSGTTNRVNLTLTGDPQRYFRLRRP